MLAVESPNGWTAGAECTVDWGVVDSASMAMDSRSLFQGHIGSFGRPVAFAGRLASVLPQIRATRADIRAHEGWVMDTYLLRCPS